jgi:ribosomal protein L37E
MAGQQPLPPARPIYGAPQQPPTQPQGYGAPSSYGQQAPPSYGQPQSFGQPPSYGQPQSFGQAAPPPTPSVCPRCYSRLYPGQTQCANCGYDTRASWGAPVPVPPSRGSSLPIALALLGIAFLVAAVALVVVVQAGGASATPSLRPSVVAAASPTSTPKPTSSTRASGQVASPAASSLAGGTPEPAPAGTWTKFTSPDGKWSASFPGTTAPAKTTLPYTSGTVSIEMPLFYLVDRTGVEYATAYGDFKASDLAGVDPEFLLSEMETGLASGGYTVAHSSATTQVGQPARDVTVTGSGQVVDIRMWFVSTRFYMMMVYSKPGAAPYPQHFFASFALK